MASVQNSAVIGSGLGGLAAALELARGGREVVVFEKTDRPGGKMNRAEWSGYRWDLGPSLLTMPHILEELWQAQGRRLHDDLELIRLPSTCRYRWRDGTVIEEDPRFWQRPGIARYLKHARGVYKLSAPTFLREPPENWRGWLGRDSLRALAHLPKIARLQTLHDLNEKYFRNAPHLLQLFDRFATYNGSSPWRTPAAFCIIPYVQAAFGGWWVKGGLYRIAECLAKIAGEQGIDLRYETPIERIEPLPDGRYRLHGTGKDYGPFNTVICNQDVLSAIPQLLPQRYRETFQRSHLDRFDLSLSGFVMLLAVKKTFPHLGHHNIFFSDDYPAEFRAIFDEGRPAENPTIYVAISAKTEPGRAPEGCENLFVLVNAPSTKHPRANTDWETEKEKEAYGDRILEHMETRYGMQGLREAVAHRDFITPAQFRDRYRAYGGGLYGFASHGAFSAFQRPGISMAKQGLPGLFFAGGSTHPGGGIPLVLQSGRMAAGLALRS